MVLIVLANGFEDAETFVPRDILIRGGIEVRCISTELTAMVTSARGITFWADYTMENVLPTKDDTVLIPGGSKGVEALLSSRPAMNFILDAQQQTSSFAAICAGPTVLAKFGLLDGVNATCFPGCEKDMAGALCHPELPVCVDGKFITARAAGSSFEFGFAVLEMIKGKAAADKVRAEMVF